MDGSTLDVRCRDAALSRQARQLAVEISQMEFSQQLVSLEHIGGENPALLAQVELELTLRKERAHHSHTPA